MVQVTDYLVPLQTRQLSGVCDVWAIDTRLGQMLLVLYACKMAEPGAQYAGTME